MRSLLCRKNRPRTPRRARLSSRDLRRRSYPLVRARLQLLALQTTLLWAIPRILSRAACLSQLCLPDPARIRLGLLTNKNARTRKQLRNPDPVRNIFHLRTLNRHSNGNRTSLPRLSRVLLGRSPARRPSDSHNPNPHLGQTRCSHHPWAGWPTPTRSLRLAPNFHDDATFSRSVATTVSEGIGTSIRHLPSRKCFVLLCRTFMVSGTRWTRNRSGRGRRRRRSVKVEDGVGKRSWILHRQSRY